MARQAGWFSPRATTSCGFLRNEWDARYPAVVNSPASAHNAGNDAVSPPSHPATGIAETAPTGTGAIQAAARCGPSTMGNVRHPCSRSPSMSASPSWPPHEQERAADHAQHPRVRTLRWGDQRPSGHRNQEPACHRDRAKRREGTSLRAGGAVRCRSTSQPAPPPRKPETAERHTCEHQRTKREPVPQHQRCAPRYRIGRHRTMRACCAGRWQRQMPGSRCCSQRSRQGRRIPPTPVVRGATSPHRRRRRPQRHRACRSRGRPA